MTITQLRTLVRNNGRDTIATYGDPAITDTLVDTALQFIADDFLLTTGFAKQSTTKQLASDTALFSITTTGFRPDRLIDVLLGDTDNDPIANYSEPLDVRGWPELWKTRADCPRTGYPSKLAFQSTVFGETPTHDGAVWPIPSDAYYLNFRWTPAFTSWTAGETDTDILATVVNLPDDILRMLAQPMCAKIQRTDPDQEWIRQALADYEQFKLKMMGAGGYGDRSVRMQSIRELRAEGRV